MKFVKMLILALGLVSLATASSFAAVAFNTTATVNMMNVGAQTGLIGSVLYTPMSPGTINAGEVISLNLPGNVPISYLLDISVSLTGMAGTGLTTPFKEAFGVTLGAPFTQVAGGTFNTYGTTMTAGTSGATISGVSVQVNQNALVVSFGSSVAFATGDFLKIDGVRVDPTAMAVGGSNMQVTLTNVSGQATTDTPQLTVATFVPETNILAITGVTGATGTSGGISFKASGAVASTNSNLVTVTLKELFPNAFETKATPVPAFGNSVAYSWTRLKITLGNLPTGVNLTGVTLAGPDGATFTNGQYPAATTPAITTQPILIAITSQNANKIESLQMGLTFGVTAGTVLPATATPITISAQLDPAATVALPYSYYGTGSTNYTFNELKYKVTNAYATGSIPISFVPLSSNLFSQFNSAIRATGGGFSYDTGFAISNLSGSNPTTLSTYPAGTPGTINVILYPMDGTGPYTVNTSALTAASAKLGLDTTGALPSKATWKVLLSQLLVPAGLSATADFTGFIRFNCNFQESAGVAYIGDGTFSTFAVGFPMAADTPTSFGGLNFNITTGVVTGNVIPPVF